MNFATRNVLVALLNLLAVAQSTTELKLPGPAVQKLMLGTWSILSLLSKRCSWANLAAR